jgi:hypothetical protein
MKRNNSFFIVKNILFFLTFPAIVNVLRIAAHLCIAHYFAKKVNPPGNFEQEREDR